MCFYEIKQYIIKNGQKYLKFKKRKQQSQESLTDFDIKKSK